MESPKFTIAIVGGSIAGLTLAIALGKYPNIQVHLYEAASKFGEIGVGLGFSPSSWDVFERLSVDQELLKHTDLLPSKEEHIIGFRRKSDQPEGFVYGKITTPARSLLFHRADCQSALLKCLPSSCQVSLSKRLASYDRSASGIELYFQDGSTAKCDILVGADGYRSAVRRCLLQERAKISTSEEEASEILSATDPLFTGVVSYRTVVSEDKLRELHPDHSVFSTDNVPVLYSGLNGFIVAYQLPNRKLVNVAAFDMNLERENTRYDGPHASQAQASDVAAVFGSFEPEVQSFIKCFDHITKWAIHSIRPMTTFVHKNVVLMGDAAHAMTPFLGAGAGQAVEDAFILATALGHVNTTKETIGRALNVYDIIRRPAALRVQQNSRRMGYYGCLRLQGVDFENRTDPNELSQDLQRLTDVIQAVVTETTHASVVDGPYQEVLRMLR